MCKKKYILNEKDNLDEIEDVTKYGEFVTSYFAWLPVEKQKENAFRLQNLGKKIKKEKEGN